MAKALVPFANGLEEIEAVTIVDVLRRGGVEVVTASIHAERAILGAHGMRLEADALLRDVVDDDYDVIILPGGGEGTENLKNSDLLARRLVKQSEDKLLIAAICAAPTVLADAGVLEESQFVTCYPTCQMELNCQWVNEPVVEHEGIITGQAPGSALTFALVILKTLVSEAVAKKVARGLVTEF